MGGLREAGLIGRIVGAALVVVGTILNVTGVGAPLGIPLTQIGIGLTTASSIAVALDPPEAPEGISESPHFGFAQFKNPVGAKAPVPVVIGRQKVAPSIMAAWLSPLSSSGKKLTGAGLIGHAFQGVSLLGACSEGPCPKDWLEELYVNDQQQTIGLWTAFTADSLGKGDGSKTKFTFPRKHVDISAVTLYLDGTKWTKNYTGTRTKLKIAKVFTTGERRSFSHTESANGAAVDIDTVVVDIYSGSGQLQPRSVIPSYSVQADSAAKFTITFDKDMYANYWVAVTYSYAYSTETLSFSQDSDGTTYAIFGTAVANGVALTADGRVKNIGAITCEHRRGEIGQAPISGIKGTTNSYSLNHYLPGKDPFTYTTVSEVDDVSVTLAALQGMFYVKSSGSGAGEVRSQDANLQFDYRKNGDSKWIALPNPAGGTHFTIAAKTTQAYYWEISFLATLKEAVSKGKIKQKVVDAFTRDRYDIRVTRLDTPNNDYDAVKFHDRLWWQFAKEFQDQKLSYPGTAYFYLDAVASDKVHGTIPNVTVIMKGIESTNLDSEDFEWTQNPAWNCTEILTSTRWGEGASTSQLITAEWVAFADYCDELISIQGATGTEVRARLDAVLDTSRSPLRWVKELMFTCNAAPVKRGRKWGVRIDKARATDKTYYFSGAAANQVMGDFSRKLDELAKTPTEVEVRFNDVDEDYQHQAVLVPYREKKSYRKRAVITANGCVRRSQAVRIATRVLDDAWMQPAVVEFTALPDAAVQEAGDVILVQSEIEGAGTTGKKWRVITPKIDPATLRVSLLCREYSDNFYALDPKRVQVPA